MQATTTSRRARSSALLLLLALATAACGGGGAVLPTEAGSGDGTGTPPTDNNTGGGGGNDGGGAGGGGGDDGGGSGGGAQPVTVTVIVGENGFSPSSVTVPVGSTVVWQVIDNHHDVTFVGDAPDGGNVPDTDEDESASRTFTVAGTYEYYCARHDGEEMGTIVVTAAGDGGTGGGDNGGGEPPAGDAVTVRTVGDSFSPSSVTIAAGGTVSWQISGDEHNVTFTGSAPPGGNIPNTEGATVSRSFPTAGRYDYFCTRHSGMSGAVTVQ